MNKLFSPLLSLKGAAMGIAEVIPGVSGGTIAFITGIYETLIESIKNVDLKFFKLIITGKFKAAFERINGLFLLSLVAGMLVGLIFGVFVVSALLVKYPEILWSFFFGLIIGSAIYILRMITDWDAGKIIALVLGVAIAYYITVTAPVNGSTNPVYVIFSGAIAISALILPGISGSFILLLLGMYTLIIPTVKNFLTTFNMDDLGIIALFASGALIGLAVFSRLLSWTFKHYKNLTLSVLSGFMIGSLNKIWPWRVPTLWMNDDGEVIRELEGIDAESVKIISEENVLPNNYPDEPYLYSVVLALLVGIISVLLLDYFDKNNDN